MPAAKLNKKWHCKVEQLGAKQKVSNDLKTSLRNNSKSIAIFAVFGN
jgi:hypothetical protein